MLQKNIITAHKPAAPFLPEEGLYILCQDRSPIASAACDRRRSYVTEACHCVEQQEQRIQQGYMDTSSATQQQTTQQADRRAQNPQLLWHHTYDVPEQGSFQLYILKTHQTPPQDKIVESPVLPSDSNPEHQTLTHICKRKPTKLSPASKERPGVFGSVTKTWRNFIERRVRKQVRPDDIVRGDDSEWDDADVPILPDMGGLGPEHDDFDLFDDLIAEEFPRIRKGV